jgi:MFS family permease
MATQKIITRDFSLNFFAQFSFSSASFVLIPTIPIYLSRLEAKGIEIGFLVGILNFCSLVPRLFIGRALLRIPERRFMIAGAVLYILSSAAYLIAPPFWPFLIVRIFQGIGLAFFSTASFTLIANSASDTHRGRIISYYSLSFNFAFAIAPYFGMLLINQFNFTVLFLVCTGLSLCTLFTTIKLAKAQSYSEESESIRKQPLLSREAFPAATMAFMLNSIWGALGAFFPLYALAHGVANPGIFFAVFAITLILGRALGARILDSHERKKVIVPCLITTVISLSMLTFSTTLFLFMVVAVILGAGWALLYPSLLIYAIEKSGSARGPAMGTFTALADLGTGLGPMIMGFILQWTNYSVMFLCLALTGVINFLFFYTVLNKGREVGKGPSQYLNSE